ncbi:uncharacterized protein EKO05_0009319 [Ascochyta rabiei]|uniref:Uncharacterized protein n=1 Tax=Didymella rabiei TaxID=5454 RepID=A0A163EUP5_DIDRA|nr:uncharacterized protein EKO05_0009319 [Ascochyta rabiei]KZM23934.1 hypothetical protein ST47_g4894 [Ascochyta rabiei]UPX19043.1 hypothetical protein EKO05_0009319 [Ascochyta rabiei]
MTILHEYATKVWSYISPRKTQQARQKPFRFKVPTIPAKPNFEQQQQSQPQQLLSPPDRDMSPESRMDIWQTRIPNPNSDVDITLVPISPPASVIQSPDSYDGDTLFNTSPISPTFDKGGHSDKEVDANDDTMVVDDGAYFFTHNKISVDERLFKQQQQGLALQDIGWPEESIFLFQKINMRGHEPIMPIEWLDDLPSLPADLFTDRLDKPFIKPVFGTHYHAQLALSSLLDLGAYVRDSIITRAPKRQPQYHVKRALTKYTNWAMKDGAVDQSWAALPLFEIITINKDVPSTVLETKTLTKLGRLHKRWQSTLSTHATTHSFASSSSTALDVPTLYGVSASHTIMAFVSYLPPTKENRDPGLRLVAMFDFGKDGLDVWNALAAAIFVVHCRNRMMQLREYLPEPETVVEEDPDV